jgi:CheY-like chemotaxis protein/uncharacterized Zn finger protein (UPF0148 family)
MSLHCPRCGGDLNPPSPDGVVVCGTCGGRLRARAPGDAGGAPPARRPRREPSPASAAPGRQAAPDPAAGGRPADVHELFAEVRILLQLVLSELKTIRELQEQTLKQAQPRPAAPVAPAAPRKPAPPMPDFSAATELPPGPEPELYPEPEPELHPEPELPPEPESEIEVFEEPALAPDRRPARSAKARRRILLIYDDVETRAAAERMLADAGFVVDTAGEGNEGLGRIGAAKPDLVVLEMDIKGEMGGEDVITLIKATMEWVDIPIVLHTRIAADAAEEARETHGADDVVIKHPASPGRLLQSIREVFDKM